MLDCNNIHKNSIIRKWEYYPIEEAYNLKNSSELTDTVISKGKLPREMGEFENIGLNNFLKNNKDSIYFDSIQNIYIKMKNQDSIFFDKKQTIYYNLQLSKNKKTLDIGIQLVYFEDFGPLIILSKGLIYKLIDIQINQVNYSTDNLSQTILNKQNLFYFVEL